MVIMVLFGRSNESASLVLRITKVSCQEKAEIHDMTGQKPL